MFVVCVEVVCVDGQRLFVPRVVGCSCLVVVRRLLWFHGQALHAVGWDKPSKNKHDVQKIKPELFYFP